MASRRNGTLYTGSTDDIGLRAWQHKEGAGSKFTAEHDVERLVWFETHETREAAFRRERQIKKWNRQWKLRLNKEMNPGWRDLVETLSA